MTVTPSKLKVLFGDTSRFYCYVNDSTPKAVVRWRKLGENHFIESKGRFTITFDEPNRSLRADLMTKETMNVLQKIL